MKIDVNGSPNSEYHFKNLTVNEKSLVYKTVRVNDAVLIRHDGNNISIRVTGSDPYMVFENINQFSGFNLVNILICLIGMLLLFVAMKATYIIHDYKLLKIGG